MDGAATTNYAIYYDFSGEVTTFSNLLLAISVCGLTAVLLIVFYFAYATKDRIVKALAVFAMLVIPVFAYLGVRKHQHDQRIKEMLVTNHCEVITGVISKLIPAPRGGRHAEVMEVNGHSFSYSSMSLAYKKTVALDGSILKIGMHVRVSHHGNDILKLEIRQDDYAAATGGSKL